MNYRNENINENQRLYTNDKEYFVYKHTSPSNKNYIGITRQNPPSKRWANGKGYSHNIYFDRAIKKYGWDNFQHEILFANLTAKEAEDKERELILFYKSADREFGYNIDLGGGLVNGREFSDETRQKISEKAKIRLMDKTNHPLYGKPMPEEVKKKIQKANLNKSLSEEVKKKISDAVKGEKHPLYGKHHTDEAKRKMRENHRDYKGKNHPMYGKHHSQETKEKLRQINLGKTIPEEVRKKISMANKGKQATKPVNQYDKEKNFIRSFNSLSEASAITNTSVSDICTCCKGRLHTANGYIWEYKESKCEGDINECSK